MQTHNRPPGRWGTTGGVTCERRAWPAWVGTGAGGVHVAPLSTLRAKTISISSSEPVVPPRSFVVLQTTIQVPAPSVASADEVSAPSSVAEPRAEAGAVVHAINNPLTVITGNEQFLMEVARTEQTDSLIVGPIEDINAATQQLSDALARLSALRERIASALGTDDRIDDG